MRRVFSRTIIGLVMGVLLASCGSASREVEFFNNTIDWKYACLPVGGETIDILGEFKSPVLPQQQFELQRLTGTEARDMVNPWYLGFYLTTLGDGEVKLPISQQLPNSHFRLISERRGSGYSRLVSEGPIALGIWDFDETYALVSIYPGYSVSQAENIEVCEYLAPARLRGKLGG